MPASGASPLVATETLQQLLTLRQPSEVQLSPDGTQIAYVAGPRVAEKGSAIEKSLWIGPVDGPARELSNGPGSSRVPRFSPDGNRLAFAADGDRHGRASLFVTAPGREPRSVAEVAGSIEDLRWLPDGRRVIVLAADPHPAVADPAVRGSDQLRRRLLRVELESGEASEVGPGDLTIWEFALGTTGTAVAVVSADASENGWYDAWVAAIDLETRTATDLHAPELQVGCPRLSPSGRYLAWIENVCSDRGGVAGPLSIQDLQTGVRQQLAEDADVSAFDWIDEDLLRVRGPRGQSAFCGTLDRVTGQLRDTLSGDFWLGKQVSSDAHGQLLATVLEAPGAPPEVVVFGAEGAADWRAVSSLNGHLKALPVPEVRELRWSAEDGLEIEGLLALPRDREGPHPTIVTIHGGPTSNWRWGFSPGSWFGTQLFTEAGYAVLLPNPRGSAGRGRAFAAANVGDLGGADLRDILAGVDACVERKIADPDRLGAWGISYGGYMAAWIAATTERFAAIACVSSHTNWLSFYNTTNIPAFARHFVGDNRYEVGGKYFRQSPALHARAASSPVLFLHGGQDPVCPVGQAEEMYQACSEAGCETELVIYPREGHPASTWGERDHAIDAWNRLRAWMDFHVRGIGEPRPDAT